MLSCLTRFLGPTMKASPQSDRPAAKSVTDDFSRLGRPVSLTAQVELALRQAIADGQFPSGRLPTETELAGQFGVSRETVRLAADALQREGLLVKVRRRGTFTQPQPVLGQLRPAESALLGYLQADYLASHRTINGLMVQGALEEAGRAGLELVVQNAPHALLTQVYQQLCQKSRLRGVIFVSYTEEKLLRRVLGQGLPIVLLDHDLHLPQVSSVQDDALEGARQAMRYLASLGHRRIAYAHWSQADINPWRLEGYRQGLRDANLPRRRRWEFFTELTEAGARQVVDQWLGLVPRPTALYCFNNTLARHVVEEMRGRGLRVPQDLSVLGAGGEEAPNLTCQQVDWFHMGRTAVQILLRALANAKRYTPEHYLSPHTLRVGLTTAAWSNDG